MEPFIKRSWIIDSVVIIVTALLLSYMHTYHVESLLFKFPLVTFLIFYFFGKAAQKYIDKKNAEDKARLEMEIEHDLNSDTEESESEK